MVKKLERAQKAAFAVPRCGLAFTGLSRIEFSLTPGSTAQYKRPGAVKAALGAAKRSLDGEDRSVTLNRVIRRWNPASAPL
jgi:hypothetical protein